MCGPEGVTGRLQVLPSTGTRSANGWPAGARRQTTLLAHLLDLCARSHLLREQRGLNPVEQSLQPTDQLSLGDAKFAIRRHRTFGERQREAVEFVAQFRR